MKLAEFLKDYFDKKGPSGEKELLARHIAGYSDEFIISGEELKLIKDKLLKLDEFRYVEEIEITQAPTTMCFKGASERVETAVTMCLAEDVVFARKVKLYSITLTPEIYDPLAMTETVKDDIVISPLFHDPKDFTSYKTITVRWSPEELQDKIVLEKKTEVELKDDIISKVRKALDNPEEYMSEAERRVAVRFFPGSLSYGAEDSKSVTIKLKNRKLS